MTQHIQLRFGDSFQILKSFEENSVRSITTDPPYGLEFMNKEWDAPWKYGFSEPGFEGKNFPDTPGFASTRNPVCRNCHHMKRGSVRHEPCVCGEDADFDDADQNVSDRQAFQKWAESWLAECYRVLKPGGVAKVFGGTRMFHRMGAAMQNVGFEMDRLEAWCYGSGFPKSMNISKVLDRRAGVERKVIGVKPGHENFANRENMSSVQSFQTGALSGEGGFARPWMDDPKKVEQYHMETAPGSEAAIRFSGWGTALKPAWEPFLVGIKPC